MNVCNRGGLCNGSDFELGNHAGIGGLDRGAFPGRQVRFLNFQLDTFLEARTAATVYVRNSFSDVLHLEHGAQTGIWAADGEDRLGRGSGLGLQTHRRRRYPRSTARARRNFDDIRRRRGWKRLSSRAWWGERGIRSRRNRSNLRLLRICRR